MVLASVLCILEKIPESRLCSHLDRKIANVLNSGDSVILLKIINAPLFLSYNLHVSYCILHQILTFHFF